ncbi:MAG: transposase [Saprospirales bacterium]|nr:transposase [Saprospirales bacterium]
MGKGQRDLSSGVDEQIIALYAQGNSVEDVRRLLAKLYGLDISAGKISAITDRVLPKSKPGGHAGYVLNTPLCTWMQCILKCHEGQYASRAFYTVYGIDAEGQRDLLGLHINQSEALTVGVWFWRTSGIGA